MHEPSATYEVQLERKETLLALHSKFSFGNRITTRGGRADGDEGCGAPDCDGGRGRMNGVCDATDDAPERGGRHNGKRYGQHGDQRLERSSMGQRRCPRQLPTLHQISKCCSCSNLVE